MRFRVKYPCGVEFCFDLPLSTELRSLTGLTEAMTDHRGRPVIELEEVTR